MHSLPNPLFRCLPALAAGIFLSAGLPAFADIDLPVAPPPQPKPLAVQVFKGESIEIPLEALNRSGSQVKFLIRKQPSKGTLSNPVATSRNTQTITYTHDANAGLGVDRFRYAAQTPDSGVSTPADVVIRIVERPPIFWTPGQLEFPSTVVGEASRMEMELRNDGGGRISGKMTVPEPWRVLSGGTLYDVGPGEKQSFVIEFEPKAEKVYSGTIDFSHSPAVNVGLSARGYDAISVIPREIVAEGDGGSEIRSAAFTMRNQTGEDREIRIEAPKEILVDDAVSIPAHSEVEVALHTRTGFIQPISGELKFSGGPVNFSVPVKVSAAPAHLTADRQAIDFGKLDSGRSGHEKLVVRNTGGSPAELRADLPDGVTLLPEPGEKMLDAGASKAFEVSFSRISAGKLEAPLVLEAGSSKLEIPLRAEVLRDTSAPTAAGANRPTAPPTALGNIPPVQSVKVTGRTKQEISLSWDKTSPNAEKYVIFLRTLGFNEARQLVYRYKPLDRSKVRFVRNEARATIRGLQPGEQITIQIVGYDADGKPSYASPPFTLSSQPQTSTRIPWTLLAILVLAAAVGVIVRERLRRRW